MYGGRRLARHFADKAINDERLLRMNISEWYTIDTTLLTCATLLETFMPLQPDTETQDFLSTACQTSNSVCLQFYYSLASTVLAILTLTKTSINGLLNRGGMFLLSHKHVNTFLIPYLNTPDMMPSGRGALLDLGAGDGAITEHIQTVAGFSRVLVTEASTPMRWRLKNRNYELVEIDDWPNIDGHIGLISALNLFDRIAEPFTLLRQLHTLAARNDCPVLLAVVFPFSQYTEFANTTTPKQHISIPVDTFEESVDYFSREILAAAGFTVVRWTRLPYLCEGDAYQCYYWLSDAVFILRTRE